MWHIGQVASITSFNLSFPGYYCVIIVGGYILNLAYFIFQLARNYYTVSTLFQSGSSDCKFHYNSLSKTLGTSDTSHHHLIQILLLFFGRTIIEIASECSKFQKCSVTASKRNLSEVLPTCTTIYSHTIRHCLMVLSLKTISSGRSHCLL